MMDGKLEEEKKIKGASLSFTMYHDTSRRCTIQFDYIPQSDFTPHSNPRMMTQKNSSQKNKNPLQLTYDYVIFKTGTPVSSM